VYKEFGAFLNAVVEVAVADFGLDAVLVRDRIDFWLDRQHLAEYSSKCASGNGCADLDVLEVARSIERSVKNSTPWPVWN
jgi:hypothetical protein